MAHKIIRAKSQEPRAKSQEPRAKSQEPRATSELTRPARTIAPSALWCGRTFLLAVFVLASLVFLSVDNALAQGTVATDRAALVALYNATGGADWTTSTNWLTNEALSEWHGVTTDATGRVASINLSNNNLRGTIPAELGSLTNLVYLNLRQNMLSGEIPAELGSLTNLQVLNLYDNELSGTIPAELGQLTNLLWLVLSDNELSGTIPAELSRLTNLQVLDLYDNELSGTIPAELGQLTNLLWLILSENILSGTIPAELSRLTNLQVLDLYENELSGTIPAELGQLTNLLWLILYDNELSGTIPAEFNRLTNLQRLVLYENELSGTIPPELGGLTNLQTLSLYENELSGTIPPELGGLTNLQTLSLYENELSGTIPAELGQLTNLQELDLSENMLSGEIPAELGGLTNLEVLDLYENELSGTIRAELGQLTNLLWLDLSENILRGTIPAEFNRLTNLQRLVLYENELSGTIPAELGQLTNLQELDLSDNELSGTIPAEFNRLTNLQRLVLYENELSGSLPLTLSVLTQLSVLDIRRTTLCAPTDTAFQAWLATINFQGAVCAVPPPTTPPTTPPGGGVGPSTSPPGAPRNLTAVVGDGQVVLSWDAPASDGGAEITDYEYRINGQNPWISIGSTETTYTVTGLDNGAEYTFQVRAVNRIGTGRVPNQAEATPEAPEVFTLDFAHFANGNSTTSDLVFVNLSTEPVRPALYFYDTEGHPIAAESVVDVTGDLEITEDGGLTVLMAMEPLGELTIATHGQGELVSGSVTVVSNAPLGGMLRFDLPGIGEAVVGASPPVSDTIFPVRRREGGITTGVAVHNLEEEAMEVSCELLRAGAVLEEVAIPLAANGQTSWLIDAAFPAADTSDFAGAVRCDAPGRRRFSAVALEVDPGTRIFTTLPVFPVDRRGGGPEAALDFAHFANGDGTTSDLVFVNLSTQPSRPAPTPFHTDIPPIRPAIYFYDTEGALVAAESVVDLTGDLEVQEDGGLTVRTEMEPLGVLTVSTHGQGALVSGSVKVLSDGPIGGMLRYNLPHIGEAVVGASPPLSDAIFAVRRREEGITTGVALHNLESSPGLVHCDLMQEGVLRDAASFPLEANGQTSWLIGQAFPAADTSEFVGSVRCDAVGEGRFSAVALEMDPATRTFTTLPVFPVPEMPSQE